MRSYTPEAMRDGYVSEESRQAQRRLLPHLKPIDSLLVKWSPEARHDGAPRWPATTILSRIIDQTALGASQAGASSTLAAPLDVEFADWAVSQLREIKRKVIYAEYVLCIGWSEERKRRRIGLGHTAWQNNLSGAREIIYTLCRTYGRILNVDIV